MSVDHFWFKKEPTYTIDIFRILFGAFILLILVISFPNWQRFYGPDGVVPFEVLAKPWMGYSWSVLTLTDRAWFPTAIYWLALASATLFTVGFKTRFFTIILFVIYASLMHRAPVLINGQDQIIIMLLFFSCFAPLGTTFSLDEFLRRLAKIKLSKNPDEVVEKPVWPQRLMQASIVLLYVFAGPSKFVDDVAWRDGSAIYYVTNSPRWFRFPNLAFFHNQYLSILLTYGTLLAEIGFPIFIWFKKTRYIALASIALLHASIMVFMASSVFYFNLAMIVAFMLFISNETISKLAKRLHQKKATIFYDGDCSLCMWLSNILVGLNAAKTVKFHNLRKDSTYQKFPNLEKSELEREIHLITVDQKVKKGFFAFRYLVGAIPALYWLFPLFYFPTSSYIGPKVYTLVSENRFSLFPCRSCGLRHKGSCQLAHPTQS